MKNNEFAYWLMGFFELHEEDNLKLTKKHIECIQSHLALTREVDSHLEEFPAWLSGYLESKESLNIEETYRIKIRLQDLFKHVIDPKYKGDPVKLQQLHGPLPKPNDILLRC